MSFLARLFLKKSIGDGNGNTFFYRYRVLDTPWLGVYIHRFVRGDMDRCLHDHPWSFLAVVLWGGYYEELQVKAWSPVDEKYYVLDSTISWRPPGSILWRPAETAHRITLNRFAARPVSLVFVGRKVRPWGFFTVDGWRQWVKGQPNPICETH